LPKPVLELCVLLVTVGEPASAKTWSQSCELADSVVALPSSSKRPGGTPSVELLLGGLPKIPTGTTALTIIVAVAPPAREAAVPVNT